MRATRDENWSEARKSSAAVDTAAVAKELPYGTVTATAVAGGLEIPAASGGDAMLIANAAVIVNLEDDRRR